MQTNTTILSDLQNWISENCDTYNTKQINKFVDKYINMPKDNHKGLQLLSKLYGKVKDSVLAKLSKELWTTYNDIIANWIWKFSVQIELKWSLWVGMQIRLQIHWNCRQCSISLMQPKSKAANVASSWDLIL